MTTFLGAVFVFVVGGLIVTNLQGKVSERARQVKDTDEANLMNSRFKMAESRIAQALQFGQLRYDGGVNALEENATIASMKRDWDLSAVPGGFQIEVWSCQRLLPNELAEGVPSNISLSCSGNIKPVRTLVELPLSSFRTGSNGTVTSLSTMSLLLRPINASTWSRASNLDPSSGTQYHRKWTRMAPLKVREGDTAANVVDANLWNTDICHFMRPRGGLGGTTLSGNKTYSLTELEPRADGKKKDEFSATYKIDPPAKGEEYAILRPLRDQVRAQYTSRNARESYVSSRSMADGASVVEVGVMPQFDVTVGPRFQYFLASNPQVGHFPLDKWEPEVGDRIEEMRRGCTTSVVGGDGADFCTRVDMPFQSVDVAITSGCVKESKSLSPGQSVTVERRAQVICDPGWPDAMNDRIEMMEKTYNVEVNFGDYVRYLDGVHPDQNDQMSGTITYQMPGQTTTPIPGGNYQDTHVGQTVAEPVSEGAVEVTSGYVEYYRLERRSEPVLLPRYTGTRCVYFAYYKPTDPRNCQVKMMGEGAADTASLTGWGTSWVCRTNDGCFAKDTLIRMADGSDRYVTHVKAGDLVWNPILGKAAIVRYVSAGPEAPSLIGVTTTSGAVKVTRTHPFFTRDGWKQARELVAGDVLVENGTTGGSVLSVRVEEKALGQPDPFVYNIHIDAGNDEREHFLLANGVTTGDLFLQRRLENARASRLMAREFKKAPRIPSASGVGQ